MRAADVFSHAMCGGQQLLGNEAQVSAVPARPKPRRAWFGKDNVGHPVAYFEVVRSISSEFSVSRVIDVRTLTVEPNDDGGEVETIKLTCHESKLADVFYAFMDEVLSRTADGSDTIDVITAAASEWRSLLQVATSELSESAAAGLYGELRFLEAALDVLGPSALDNWQRSEQDIHDFIADGARVEVKTSAFQNRSAVTVHGLKQLDPPLGATLTIAVAEVQRHGDEGVETVIDRILEFPIDRETFRTKLLGAKYVRGMPGSSEHTFTLQSWRFWDITAETPVLNVSALPQATVDAISAVSYTLDLGVLGPAHETFDFHRLASAERDGE